MMDNLTQPDADLAHKIKSTVPGMAHWAGSGPARPRRLNPLREVFADDGWPGRRKEAAARHASLQVFRGQVVRANHRSVVRRNFGRI
jgi:hypothetical protein